MLRELYAEGVPGAEAEFASLGLLYALLAGGRGLLSAELAGLRPQLLHHERVHFALQVIRAVRCGGLAPFWRCYHGSAGASRHLMDALAAKLRPKYYDLLLRAYLPSLPLHAATRAFGFDEPEEVAAYVTAQQGVVDAGRGVWDIKASRAVQAQ